MYVLQRYVQTCMHFSSMFTLSAQKKHGISSKFCSWGRKAMKSLINKQLYKLVNKFLLVYVLINNHICNFSM